MEYYEFHYLVKDLLDFLQKENDANSSANEQASASTPSMPNMKMPKMPSMKMPKM
jgi:hypothetical protein